MGLVITGMHRSGTSATARLVDAVGMSQGIGDPMEKIPENPRGFFERRDVADFNDLWLERLGGAWNAPPATSRRDLAELPDSMFHEARDELDLFSADAGNWFVKDPRISLILPIWDRLALRQLPTILVVRSPREVAGSLAVRNSFPARLSLALWLRYVNSVLEVAEQRQMLVLDYGRMLADPPATATAIVDFLLDIGAQPAASPDIEGLARLMEPDLNRHHSIGLDAVDEAMESDLTDLHAALSAISGERFSGQVAPIPLPRWAQDALDDTSRLWRAEVASRALEGERAAVARAQAEVSALRDAELRMKVALHERDSLEDELDTLERAMADKDTQSAMLRHQLAGVEGSKSYRYGMKVKRVLKRSRDKVISRRPSGG